MADRSDRRTVATWDTIERSRVYRGKVFSVDAVRRRSRGTGAVHEFQVIDTPDWVNVIAVTPERHVVLIRQFRHGTGELTLEIPGGMVDPDDNSVVEAARRELREETGYDSKELVEIGMVHPNPAIQGNRQFSYLARDAARRHDVAFDETEEIEVVLEPLDRVPELVRQGAITHSLVLNAFFWLELHGGLEA